MRSFAAIASMLVSVAMADADIAWESLGKFDVKNAAFPVATKFEDSEDFLLMSSFGAISTGEIYVIPNIKDAIMNNDVTNLEPIKYDFDFVWPNAIDIVPFDIFGERAIYVPDGFIPPGKTNGGIYVLRISADDVTQATEKV